METRRCGRCKQQLTEDHFTPGVWKNGATGKRCRACAKEYAAQHYLKNREERLAKTRAASMLRLYGLTAEGYALLLAAQGGRCAICSTEHGWRHRQSGKPKKLAVDHCHETGQVRGLLCDRCNTSIGKLNHDTDLLRKAINYLATVDRSGA